MPTRACIIALLLLGPWMMGNSSCRNIEPLHHPPPDHWAVRLEGESFKDFFVVKHGDDLYRGAQPSPQQFKALHQLLGVKTAVNVRRTRSDEEVVETLGVKYIQLPIPAWSLKEEHAVEFLKIMRDPDNHPVFLYCHFGGDRSNALTAIYRMAVQGWCPEEAIREMTEGGNYFHPLWQNLIRTVREIDVERVRKLAGYEGSLATRCVCDRCGLSNARMDSAGG